MFKAHRLVYHPTLGSIVKRKKKNHVGLTRPSESCTPHSPALSPLPLAWGERGEVIEALSLPACSPTFLFGVHGLEIRVWGLVFGV